MQFSFFVCPNPFVMVPRSSSHPDRVGTELMVGDELPVLFDLMASS